MRCECFPKWYAEGLCDRYIGRRLGAKREGWVLYSNAPDPLSRWLGVDEGDGYETRKASSPPPLHRKSSQGRKLDLSFGNYPWKIQFAWRFRAGRGQSQVAGGLPPRAGSCRRSHSSVIALLIIVPLLAIRQHGPYNPLLLVPFVFPL